MTEKHPITPSPELVEQWVEETLRAPFRIRIDPVKDLVHKAAQWGSDQELEACCEWLAKYRSKLASMDLRHVRRPEPPSLKKQALNDLDELLAIAKLAGIFNPPDSIRKALEALPND